MSALRLLLALTVMQISPLAARADDAWQFRLTPYLWFAGLKGDVATIPGAPSAPIDISPSEALNDTEAQALIDLMPGIKGRMPLGNAQFWIVGGTGVGGFGVGSDLFCDLSGAIGAATGCRMFDVDYEDDGFAYAAGSRAGRPG